MLLALCFILSIFTPSPPRQTVDLILINANIYTVDERFSKAEALAIHEGKIVAVGTALELRKTYEASRTIDLKGKTVIPGLIDAHCHFYGYAIDLSKIWLVGTKSFQEVLDTLSAHKDQKFANWIFGRGWDQNDWEVKEFPTREQLDKLFPNIPVILLRIDGHAALVNQMALDMAQIKPETVIAGGEILKKDGKLTGILIDNAVDLIKTMIPPPSSGLVRKSLMMAQRNCFEVGLTGVVDCGIDGLDVERIDSMQQAGLLKMRISAMLSDLPDNFKWIENHGTFKTQRMHVIGFKFYADGALGSRGACLLHPYSDLHGHTGFLLKDASYFRKTAQMLSRSGLQMCTHAIGDSANRVCLQIYKEALPAGNDRRWRIEHAQVVDPADFHLFGDSHIIPSVQPTHATSDMYWAGDRLGKKRIKSAYAYQTLLKQNGWLPLGTDFPVEDISPLKTFYAAVARKDAKAWPKNGFLPNQKLSREEALRGSTIWAAKGSFEENEKGSLEKGKWADLVILDRDIMQVSESDILKTKVLCTIIQGEVVFGKLEN